MDASERVVLITGGAGYVGAALAPKLVAAGYRVKVLDTCWYGGDVFPTLSGDPRFSLIVGDIRDPHMVRQATEGCSDVIHLACISNDPSYDLDPALGEDVNFRAFEPLVSAAKEAGVNRFIYASSSSVYGVKEELHVTEDLPLEPLTDYSKFKAQCEPLLLSYANDTFVTTVVRPATVCGYSPRQRLDVVVNILVNHAVNRGTIRVFGGTQYRPNLHIDDMCDAYLAILAAPAEKVQCEIFNIGGINHTVREIAEIVQSNVPVETRIEVETTDDNRSYRVSSQHIYDVLGFAPQKGVPEAVQDLVEAFASGKLPNSFDDSRYFNIKRMNEILHEASAT